MAESRADTGERFTDEDVACEKHSLTVYSHLRCPYCHIEQAVARAESAEARCEALASALKRIARCEPTGNAEADAMGIREVASAARAALEDADQ